MSEASDDEIFLRVAKELAANQADPGLWTKAFALENGDDRKTKAHYIRLRVEQFQLQAIEAQRQALGQTARPEKSEQSAQESSPPPFVADQQESDPASKLELPNSASIWDRFWARNIDFLLCMIVFLLLTSSLASTDNIFINIAIALIVPGIVLIAYDAVLISSFGSTVGKAVFGIRVAPISGSKLPMGTAVRRAVKVWANGNGCYLFFPLASMLLWWSAKHHVAIAGTTSWDDACETIVEQQDIGGLRKTLGVVMGITALVVAIAGASLVKKFNKEQIRESMAPEAVNQTVEIPKPIDWNEYKPLVQREAEKASLPSPVQPISYRRVVIGVVAPMTGPQAHLGLDIERGVRLAIEELNRWQLKVSSDVLTFELVLGDDQANPAVAQQIARKMVASGVTAVIGHMNSGTSIPAAKIYSEAGVVQISPSSTNPALTKLGYSTVFRLIANDSQQGKALGDFAYKLGVKKVVIIDDRTAYGQGLADEFRNRTEALGIKTVANAFVDTKTTDFRGVLRTVDSARPDLVFLGGMDTQGGPLVKQMKDAGISALFLGGDGVCTPEFMTLAGSASNGHYCSLHGMPIEISDKAKSFHSLFKSRFGEIQLYAPNAYDAALVLGHAIQSARSTEPVASIGALKSVEMAGIVQNYRFSSSGDLISAPVSIYQYKIPHIEYRETMFLH